MAAFFDLRDPPPNRRSHCADGQEKHLTEGAVMVAFALHLIERGANSVELHPDGEHGKRYDIRRSLEERGFEFEASIGTTSYGGRYRRGEQAMIVTLSSGLGDIVQVGKVIAGCKGGIVTTRHAGQLSRLRRGLCEAVGLLMARPREEERHIAVVPFTETSLKLAKRGSASGRGWNRVSSG